MKLNIFQKVMLRIRVAFKPSYWVMINKYSKPLDEKVNAYLDAGEEFFPEVNRFSSTIYKAMLGDLTLWITNYPYGAISVQHMRCSRATILRCEPLVEKALLEANVRESA